MTNKELIEKLSKFPMDAEVLIPIPEDKHWDKLKRIDIVTFHEQRNEIGLIWSDRQR